MVQSNCSACGCLNFRTDHACRRCGKVLSRSTDAPTSPRDAARRSTWLYTLLVVTLISGGAYYVYTGFMKSFEQVQTTEPRIQKPAVQPAPAISRTESDQRRTTPFRNAIQNSQGLTQAGKHNADVEKLMQPAR
jgi:hypothetical protein